MCDRNVRHSVGQTFTAADGLVVPMTRRVKSPRFIRIPYHTIGTEQKREAMPPAFVSFVCLGERSYLLLLDHQEQCNHENHHTACCVKQAPKVSTNKPILLLPCQRL